MNAFEYPRLGLANYTLLLYLNLCFLVNKVSLEESNAHSLTWHAWVIFPPHNGHIAWPIKLKCLQPGPLKKVFFSLYVRLCVFLWIWGRFV